MKDRSKKVSNLNKDLFEDLKIDCSKCFGFCCVALYFSTMDGFPEDKKAGQPCINLNENFTCKIHKDLRNKGLKGCTHYDCFGAGQKVAKQTYENISWKESSSKSKEMYDVFLIMRNLHEMIWYLKDSLNFIDNSNLKNRIESIIKETYGLTNLSGKDIMSINIENHRMKVNDLLKEARKSIIEKINHKKKKDLPLGFDFTGKNLSKRDLRGENLAGALLIGANLKGLDLSYTMLIGADLRDADISDANLEYAMFITQSQINSAKGNSNTRLPSNIVRPSYWKK